MLTFENLAYLVVVVVCLTDLIYMTAFYKAAQRYMREEKLHSERKDK